MKLFNACKNSLGLQSTVCVSCNHADHSTAQRLPLQFWHVPEEGRVIGSHDLVKEQRRESVLRKCSQDLLVASKWDRSVVLRPGVVARPHTKQR